MRYVCPICGYIYDEAAEGVPFDSLPDSWGCPLCGAPKLMFEPEAAPEPPKPQPAAAPLAAGDDDMQPLSAGALAALCSNLARGCEKQYKEEEAALFRQIADFYTAAAPAAEDPSLEALEALFRDDLDSGYPGLSAAATAQGDRGTQRICVWGEKVTQMLYALLSRYQREGEAFLRGTQVWVCSVCGFLYIGDTPPEICPVCKVPAWKFDKIEGRRPA